MMAYLPACGPYTATRRHRLLWALTQVMARLEPLAVGDVVKAEAAVGSHVTYQRQLERLRMIWETVARHKIEQQFRREREAVLRHFVRVPRPLDHKLDDVLEQYQDEWFEMLETIYEETGRAFGSKLLQSLRIRRDAIRKQIEIGPNEGFLRRVASWLRRFGAERVVEISETTRRQLRRTIARGVEAGESVREIAQRIDGLFLDEIIPHRSLVIARTEVLNASSLATHSAARESRLPLDHVWLAVRDDRTRESHKVANGQRRPLEEPFIVGGERLMHPGDNSFGASAENIIQCRCAETFERRRR